MEDEIAVGVIYIVKCFKLRMPDSPSQLSLELLLTVYPCPIKPLKLGEIGQAPSMVAMIDRKAKEDPGA